MVRVLIIEDNPLDVELLVRYLVKEGFDFKYEVADSLEKIQNLITEKKFDISICDFRLHGFSGLDALKLIQDLNKDIPVILASGTIPDEKAVDAVLAGAKDYVLKDDLQRLSPAIKRELQALEERRQKRRSNRILSAVFNSSVGVRISDENREIIEVNDAYCEMMGYSKEELIGSNLSIVTPASREEYEQEHYFDLISGDKIIPDEHETKREIKKDGSSIDLLVSSKVISDQGQKLLVCTLKDVSEVFKYKTLFEEGSKIAQLGGWERDIATGKEMWTKGIYDIYEVDEKSFDPAKDSDDKFHTQESLELMKQSMKKAEEGFPFDIEVEIVTAKGNKKWCRGTGNPVFEDDKVVKLIGSFQDITDQKMKALEIEKSEEKYRFLFDRSPNPMIIFDAETDEILEVNSIARALYGYTKDEFLKMKAEDLRPQDQKKWYKTTSSKFDLDSNETRFFPGVVHQKKNNEKMFVDIYARYTTLNGRNANIVTLKDITEKKGIEDALIESERKYRNLVEASHDLVWRIDIEGNFTFINNASKSILGYSPKEIVGNSFIPYVRPEKAQEAIQIHKDVVSGKVYDSFQLEMVTSKGDIRHLNATAYPVVDGEGSIIGCSGTATDITHIYDYQEQLEESLAEKEILIKEIHHRVKNNLAIISGLFVLQSMTVKDKKTLQILNESQSRIKSIAAIHEKLYKTDTFSSIEMVDYLEGLSVDISKTYDDSKKPIDVIVKGDEISLNVNQAVPFGILASELLVNAYKYAFEGKEKGLIEIILKAEGEDILFEVRDDGVGLPEGFEMSELNSLGMTLIRTLTDQLEGTLNWKSEKGKGVAFTIRFRPDKVDKATWVQKEPVKTRSNMPS